MDLKSDYICEGQMSIFDITFDEPRKMNILVACEESQAVTKELRALGHRAFSCDIQECSGGHPEWHIKGDCLPLLNGRCEFVLENGETDRQTDRWDLIIAHPPCTHLAVSGAKHFEQKRADGRQREGIEFFCQFLDVDCDRIAIENPVGIISGDYIPNWFPDLAEKYHLPRPQSQIIQPYMFGDAFEKKTCLWLKGLEPLKPTDIVEPPPRQQIKGGKSMPEWYSNAPKKKRAKIRSKTFPGIAKAMATQWTV